jgi:hypothetical protein
MAKGKAKTAEVNGEDLHDVPVTLRPEPKKAADDGHDVPVSIQMTDGPDIPPLVEGSPEWVEMQLNLLDGLEAKVHQIFDAGKSELFGHKTHAINLGTDKETFVATVNELKERGLLPADSFARIREGRGTGSGSKDKGRELFDEQEFADELNADTSRLVAFLKRLDGAKVQAAIGKAKALADLEAEFERRRKELLG